MPSDKPHTDRPEAGADTEQGRQGQPPDRRPAQSGGSRTRAGSDYGDFVPERSQKNDDLDADDPVMGNYYSGGGELKRLGEEPAGPSHPEAAPEKPERSPKDETIPQKEETVAEANRNKGFDTTHVHTSTTSRKV